MLERYAHNDIQVFCYREPRPDEYSHAAVNSVTLSIGYE